MKFYRAINLTLILLAALTLAACVPVGVVQQVPPPPTAVVDPAHPVASAAAPPSAPTAAPTSTPAPSGEATSSGAGIANPASVNCTDKGGALTIEKRGDGGEFGVCTFTDNRQCEEWALLRGYCPVGGVKVTGFITPAARYCAITGGHYQATGDAGLATETGMCTLPDGVECDAGEYWAGACPS